jgi:mannose-6-phosphate isomerase-like protein (cupin superfamily)
MIRTAHEKTTYAKWVRNEGVAVYEDWYVEDIFHMDMSPWPRMGGRGVIVTLYPMLEGQKGMYVAEIPPGGALNPIRHIYEEMIMVLEGHGATEVWQEGDTGKHVFEWGPGTVFCPPLNAWHRLYNLSQQPAKVLGVTGAPLMMNGFRNVDFVFNCPYTFRERFDGEDGYFTVNPHQYVQFGGRTAINMWETNLVHNAFDIELKPLEVKAAGNYSTHFEMAGNGELICHIAEWPVGRYHKAHFHGAGALLMGLRSEGYVLLWSNELGQHPYERGYESEVVEVPWKRGSIYTPPTGWFHQHFNTGNEPARHIAIRHGTVLKGPGFGPLTRRDADPTWHPQLTDISEGGTLIDYENEDPAIRERYAEALKRNGVPLAMSASLYERGAARAVKDPRFEE